MEIPQTDKISCLADRGLGLQRKGRNAIHRKIKKSKHLLSKCARGHWETMGPRGLLPKASQGPSLSLRPSLYPAVVVYDDGSLPGEGLLSKFFQAVVAGR